MVDAMNFDDDHPTYLSMFGSKGFKFMRLVQRYEPQNCEPENMHGSCICGQVNTGMSNLNRKQQT